MDTSSYISSGVLELYSLGLLADDERAGVEKLLADNPEIREEVDKIGLVLETYAHAHAMQPSTANKTKLLLRVYEEESGAGKLHPPLIGKETVVADFENWLTGKTIAGPEEPFENLFVADLPSTDTVMNAMVWAKTALDPEEHSECNEFIVILKGHCDMYMNGQRTHYGAGEIIRIPPHISHYAVITSEEPMVAIVQRQLIAA